MTRENLKYDLPCINFGISGVLVNTAYQLFMKVVGAETMFFNAKRKLGIIIILGIYITSKIMGAISGGY